jgi:hypothetical protein
MNYAEYCGFDGISGRLRSRSIKREATPHSIFEAIDEHNLSELSILCEEFSANCYEDDEYPIHYALRTKKTDAVPILLKAGADICLRSRGSQPLHIAADKGLDCSVRHLLRAGADVNDKNRLNGSTALHFAVMAPHLSTVEALMQNGADPLITNNRGYSALELALSSPNHNLVMAMIKGGLMKRVKAADLLTFAVQARRVQLAFMVSTMQRKSWGTMVNLSVFASRLQLKFLTKRQPNEGMHMLRENLQKGNVQSCWAVLDAM